MKRTKNSDKVLIEVTEKDIKMGKKGDGYSCPIARAIKRALRKKITVHSNGVYSIYNFSKVMYKISLEARLFIDQFDRGNSVKPIKFYIKYVNVKNPIIFSI